MAKKVIIVVVLLVVVCLIIFIVKSMSQRSNDIKTSVSAEMVFPIKLLPQDQLTANYVLTDFNLSPLPQYNFKMAIAKDWKIVNTALKTEIPSGDTQFHSIGLTQIRDAQNNPEAQIEVLVAKLPNGIQGSLKDAMVKQYGHNLVTVDNYRKVGSGQDILFTYKDDGGQLLASRQFVFTSNNGDTFMISGTTALLKYNQYADDFYTAMATFK